MKRQFITAGISLMCLITLSVCMQASESTRSVEILTRSEQGKIPDCVFGDGYCFLDEYKIAEGLTLKKE